MFIRSMLIKPRDDISSAFPDVVVYVVITTGLLDTLGNRPSLRCHQLLTE